ncbi:uncharacterized protein at1g76070 [Phtheirospermum japonicum]|uniref:Uncharacterized protein at1g76070 n=1 Tax=Phtheirospermum japonicum TaxID=374723 RepID=A0A830BDH2_9LAMI|nr:uncharacterized protein at1g76070 [Phtheirospermum japonicum]
MGQIKHKKVSLPNELRPGKIKKAGPTGPNPEAKRKKKKSGIKEMILGGGRKSGPSIDRAKPPIRGAAPSLIQTRKFASSRDGLASFDWTAAQIAPAEDREYCSDGERGYSDGEDDVIVSFSAPMRAGLDLEPRKEINLWNRRNMARLKPLELNKDKEI